ncbi:MAG: hypothetical protein ABIJ95_07565, partial [Pseudomonadota bacterium]
MHIDPLIEGIRHSHSHGENHGSWPEPPEMAARKPRLTRELAALLARVKDMRLRKNPEPLHESAAHAEKAQLVKLLAQALLEGGKPGLKRPVAERMARVMGHYFLWQRATTFPVAHELGTLTAWWLSHMPAEVMPVLRDAGLHYVLNGQAMPPREVMGEILDAPAVYLSHCVCRSSGISDDLRDANGEVRLTVGEEKARLLVDRLADRYEALMAAHGSLPDTDGRFDPVFAALARDRSRLPARQVLQNLFAATYPGWEILPVTDRYTQAWVRSLHVNRKCHLLNKELAFLMAMTLYGARGVMFTTMKCLGQPYTICSCPSPEHGGGCALTNWYYYGGSNASILPNKEGQRRSPSGRVLPCSQFSGRSIRDCLG